MKKAKHIILAFVLLAFSQTIYAQDYDFYLQKARQRLAEGDCSRAETSYNTYKDLTHKTNHELERLIEDCLTGGNTQKNESTRALNEYFVKNGITTRPTPSGLVYVCTQQGKGETPKKGRTVKINYTTKLLDGTVIDSSHDRGEPCCFTMGMGQVIAGLDEGVALMKEGEKGVLYIPYYLGYGTHDAGVVPAFSNLVFEVELLEISESKTGNERQPLQELVLTEGYYIGEVANGKPQGQGIMYYNCDDRLNRIYYEGNWKNGIKEGYGVTEWKNGTRYEGNYKNGAKSGQGVYYWENGDREEGQWKHDKMNGHAVYYWSDGSIEEGQYKNDLREGMWLFHQKDGKTLKVKFSNGKMLECW